MLPKDKIYRLKLIFVLIFVALIAVVGWQNISSPAISASVAENTNNNSATNAETKTVLNHSPENSAVTNKQPKAANEPEFYKKQDDEPLEGCIKCHGNTEPMHRYNRLGDALDELKNGRGRLVILHAVTAASGGDNSRSGACQAAFRRMEL